MAHLFRVAGRQRAERALPLAEASVDRDVGCQPGFLQMLAANCARGLRQAIIKKIKPLAKPPKDRHWGRLDQGTWQ